MKIAKPLVIVGAGGFGREVIDVVDAVNADADGPAWDLLGVLDDGPSEANLERLMRRGVSYLGGVDAYLLSGRATHYVVGIGSPQVRRAIADQFDREGLPAATLVHPTATMGFDARVGEGSIVCAGVRLTTNIDVGRHVHLNPNVTVGHDTRLGDFVSMNPSSSVSGDCDISDGVLIGVGATVLNRIHVGTDAVVGGSACVVHDVAAEHIVKGVPAR